MPRDVRLYIDDILEAIHWIREYIRGLDFNGFSRDRRTQDAVVRNLEIISEAARKLPRGVQALASEIEWPKVLGLRNILVHEYFGVSLPIIWDIAKNKLGPLEHGCKAILDGLAAKDIN